MRSKVRIALWGGLLILSAACASFPVSRSNASVGDAVQTAKTSESTPLLQRLKLGSTELEAELTSPQVVDGGVLAVTLKVPTSISRTLSVGEFKVNFDDRVIPIFPAEAQGDEKTFGFLIGVPYGTKPGPASVEISIGSDTAKVSFEVLDGKYASETLKVNPKHVNPKAKDLKRILREQKEVGALYRNTSPEKNWSGPFLLPIDSPITSPFGTKRVFNGQLQSFHSGLDLKAPVGTPIKAPAQGKVVMAKDLFFTGNTVILDHGYGIFTVYAHMSKVQVKVGDKVGVGHLLGLSGMTGRASGPHLHWGAVVHRTKVNPFELTRILR